MDKLEHHLKQSPLVSRKPSNSVAKWVSNNPTYEERVRAVTKVLALHGAEMEPDAIAAIAAHLTEISRPDLERAVALLGRDEKLTEHVRFGKTIALSDFYRVLRREDPVPDAISVEDACRLQPALAESIRAGEITSIEGRNIERDA
jgi:hypothetical protein